MIADVGIVFYVTCFVPLHNGMHVGLQLDNIISQDRSTVAQIGKAVQQTGWHIGQANTSQNLNLHQGASQGSNKLRLDLGPRHHTSWLQLSCASLQL